MGKPRGKRARVVDPEDRWFEVYREMREELRGAPGLPDGFDPVIEMAKLSQRKDIGPALQFLCLKEVASYVRPRMGELRGTALEAASRPALPAPGGAVTRFGG